MTAVLGLYLGLSICRMLIDLPETGEQYNTALLVAAGYRE